MTPSRMTDSLTLHSVWLNQRSFTASTTFGTSTSSSGANFTSRKVAYGVFGVAFMATSRTLFFRASERGVDRIRQQHRDGHRSDTARNGRDPRRALGGRRVFDVAAQLSIGAAIDADVHDD